MVSPVKAALRRPAGALSVNSLKTLSLVPGVGVAAVSLIKNTQLTGFTGNARIATNAQNANRGYSEGTQE